MRRYLNLSINLACSFTLLISSLAPLHPAMAGDLYLPAPGVMINLSPEYSPPILKGIKVYPDNPFIFDFILNQGESRQSGDQLKTESAKLIKYFLAGLTIPKKDLWVNLSPYEKKRIIPTSFGLTEMGRDLLAEDYLLKQITASLIYPENAVGKKFWERIYRKAALKYGSTNIPVNTFNKVWIVPDKAVVYENARAATAYVIESRLKVMLEEDYLALEKNRQPGDMFLKERQKVSPSTSALGSQVVREIILPELTREVNEGRNFAQLRQVYNSLVLACWYKEKIRDSILSQIYADRSKVRGINIDDPQEGLKIYQRYLQAFKKGVYNYIKEDQDPATGQMVPRKYFSGGVEFGDLAMITESSDEGLPIDENNDKIVRAQISATGQEVPYAQGALIGDKLLDEDYKAIAEAPKKAGVEGWWTLGFPYRLHRIDTNGGAFMDLFRFPDGAKPDHPAIGLMRGLKTLEVVAVKYDENGEKTGLRFRGSRDKNGMKETKEVEWVRVKKGQPWVILMIMSLAQHYRDIDARPKRMTVDGWYDLTSPVNFMDHIDPKEDLFDRTYRFPDGSRPGEKEGIGLMYDLESFEAVAVKYDEKGQKIGLRYRGSRHKNGQAETKRVEWVKKGEKWVILMNIELADSYREIDEQAKEESVDGWHPLKSPVDLIRYMHIKNDIFKDVWRFPDGSRPEKQYEGVGMFDPEIFEAVAVKYDEKGQKIGLRYRLSRVKERIKETVIVERIKEGEKWIKRIVSTQRSPLALVDAYKEIDALALPKEYGNDGWQPLQRPVNFKGFIYKQPDQFIDLFRFPDGSKPEHLAVGLMYDLEIFEAVAVKYNEKGQKIGLRFRGSREKDGQEEIKWVDWVKDEKVQKWVNPKKVSSAEDLRKTQSAPKKEIQHHEKKKAPIVYLTGTPLAGVFNQEIHLSQQRLDELMGILRSPGEKQQVYLELANSYGWLIKHAAGKIAQENGEAYYELVQEGFVVLPQLSTAFAQAHRDSGDYEQFLENELSEVFHGKSILAARISSRMLELPNKPIKIDGEEISTVVESHADQEATPEALLNNLRLSQLLPASLKVHEFVSDILVHGESFDGSVEKYHLNPQYARQVVEGMLMALRTRGYGPRAEVLRDKFFRSGMYDASITKGKDNAMPAKSIPGGIDFNTDKVKLQVLSNHGPVQFHLDPSMLKQLQNAPGFVPIVISIQPVSNLRVFLETAGRNTHS